MQLKSTNHKKRARTEYYSWYNAKRRCYYPDYKDYSNYGARGIKMCEEWQDNFEQFLKDMGPKPAPKYSIERINNNGNYEPSNCKWATAKEQNNNSRNNRYITFQNRRKTISQWAAERHIKLTTLRMRIDVYNWSLDRALGY